MANRIAGELKYKGHVSRGRLGVYLQEMNKDLARALGLSGQQAL